MGKLIISIAPQHALAPTEALLVSSSMAFDRLHDNIKFLFWHVSTGSYVLKKDNCTVNMNQL